MCGIVCVFKKNKESVFNLPDMLDTISHRGKDQSDIFHYDKCSVGFRRLAITEISKGQPNEKGKVKVFLNGEIYNYKDLGYDGNEVEVISQGIEAEGMPFINKLNGMFALIVVDGENVYAIRDRYGIKPLYKFENNEVIIISSEIKPILKYHKYTVGINKWARKQWVVFNNYLTTETIFKNVSLVEKGTINSLNDGTKIKYWEWKFERVPMNYSEAVEKVSFLVRQAVSRMIPQEVSYGASLSGGIDSGIIANLLPDYSHTFTVGYEGVEDERELARLSGNIHHEIVFDEVKYFDETIYHLEDLRVGASWAHYGLFKEAAKHVKVVLEGAGADELFGGYNWRYIAPNYYDVVNRTKNEDEFCKHLFKWNEIDRYKFDAEYFLEGVLLVVDRISMASTIEVRLPFLDNDLVEFARTLPLAYINEKRILKEAFKDILPEPVLLGKKKGFSTPDWIGGDGNQANKWATAAYNQWIKTFIL